MSEQTDYERIAQRCREGLDAAYMGSHNGEKLASSSVTIEPNKIEVYDGYSGFYSVLSFDDNGKLLSISAWE